MLKRGAGGDLECRVAESGRRHLTGTLLWGGAAVLCVLLTVVSWSWTALWVDAGGRPRVTLSRGGVRIVVVPSQRYPQFYTPLLQSAGLRVERTSSPMLALIGDTLRAGNYGATVYVPVWLLAIMCGVVAAALWKIGTPLGPPECLRCGYDLTGNKSGRCPECGAEVGRVKRRVPRD